MNNLYVSFAMQGKSSIIEEVFTPSEISAKKQKVLLARAVLKILQNDDKKNSQKIYSQYLNEQNDKYFEEQFQNNLNDFYLNKEEIISNFKFNLEKKGQSIIFVDKQTYENIKQQNSDNNKDVQQTIIHNIYTNSEEENLY